MARNIGRKVEEEVAEKKGQEAGNFAIAEHLLAAEAFNPCREGTPYNRAVRDREASRGSFHP